MPRLTIVQGGKTHVYPFEGDLPLSRALQELGLMHPHPCGGRGACGKCAVILNGAAALSCRTTLSGDAHVLLPDGEALITLAGDQETGRLTPSVCLCLDLGTTTLALALVSLDEQRIIKTVCAPNPQRAFGADVISRIAHCREHGPKALNSAVLAAVQGMIDGLLAAFSLRNVPLLYVSGNTTMLHLFFGVDCSAMGASPYTPAFLASRTADAASLPLRGIERAVSLPGMSAFVGADVTAGILHAGLPPEGKHHLLVDLGTNAEIALFSRESLLCTAAAAGPCFEGANISCGMSAAPGAVCAVSPQGTCSVIGGGQAKGLCATGLIDAVALGLRRELIDETGFLEETMPLCAGVSLSAKDVREFQLAKSAIRAAVDCLMRRAGVSPREIDRFFVAGGFSAGINVQNAAFVGLFDGALAEKFCGVNNASLLGCVRYACGAREEALPAAPAQVVDLAADPLFSQLFMEYMMF